MRTTNEPDKIRTIIFGSIAGGVGATTSAICYALAVGKKQPDTKVLVITSMPQVEYLLQLEAESATTSRGSIYSRYAIGNVVFSPYNQQFSAIDAENPDLVIIDRGLILKHFNKSPNDELVYIWPEEHSLLPSIAKYRNLENGKIFKFPIKLLFTIHKDLKDYPMQVLDAAEILGELLYRELG